MVKFFETIYNILSGRKGLVAVSLLILMAGFFFLSLRMSYEEDIAKFLPRNERNEKYAEVYEHLSNPNRIVIVFSSKDTLNVVPSDSIVMAMDDFAASFGHGDVRVRVDDGQEDADGEGEGQMMETMRFVCENIPYFLTDEDYARMDSLLADDGTETGLTDYISEQLIENKKLLNLPTASVTMESMRYDPLHLFTPVLSRMRDFKMTDAFDVIDGCVFTRDGRSGLAFYDSPFGMSESAHNAALRQTLDSAMTATENAYPSLRVSAIGAPLVAVTNASQIKKDSLLAVSLSVVLILAILLIHYRRLSYLLWLGCSLVFGWLFAIAGVSLFHGSISVIVLGIGSVIIGIAVNYPLHYLDHLREMGDTRQTLREMVPPLLIGNITTVSAFLCLVWLDAAAMRDLGLFGSLMLIGTILFVLVFLPLYARCTKESGRPGLFVRRLRTFCPAVSDSLSGGFGHIRSHGYLWVIMLVVTLVLGYFSLDTSFDANLQHINYMTDQQRSDMRLLTAVSSEAPVYAVAEGKTLEEALRANETALQPCMEQLRRSGAIKQVNGIGSFVPTEAAQAERLRRWHAFWEAHAHDVLAELRRQGEAQGFNDQAFAPFCEMLEHPYEPQSLSFFEPITRMLRDTYIQEDERTGSRRVVNYVQTDEEEQVKEALNRSLSPAVFAFSSQDVGSQLVQILSDSFNYIGFVCGFVVFVFLWISFGSVELSLLSFLPLAVSWIWILGLMRLMGVQFNIVNVILATFIFGQGDDYTIFMTEGLIYEYTTGRKRLASYRRSVALSAVLMFIGIGTLIFAKHPALRSLAEVTIIGMFTVVLMAYYLPPLVFRWLTRHRDGSLREVPITLSRLARSLFSIVFFLLMMYLFVLPYTWLYFHIGKNTEEKRLRYHQLLQKLSDFVIHHVPGVRFHLRNRVGETFEQPAVVICNHQSHLDLMCLMMLTPKIVFLTNDWVWHNPFYGLVVHQAEFYPVSDGIESHLGQLRSLYQRGYSICVFPEGTRSADCSILRFHKGAFYLAEQLGADILPVFLHGVGHVLPKKDFMLRKGRIDVEVRERVPLDDPRFDQDLLRRTKQMRAYYREHYASLCEQLEDEAYWAPYRACVQKYKMKSDGE